MSAILNVKFMHGTVGIELRNCVAIPGSTYT